PVVLHWVLPPRRRGANGTGCVGMEPPCRRGSGPPPRSLPPRPRRPAQPHLPGEPRIEGGVAEHPPLGLRLEPDPKLEVLVHRQADLEGGEATEATWKR